MVELHINAYMYGFEDVIIESILVTKFICICSEASHLLHDYCIIGIRGEEYIFYYIFVFFNRYLHICGFPPFAFYPTFYLWARLMTMVICACVGGNDKVLGDEMIEGKI